MKKMTFLSCVFCFGRLRQGVAACTECRSSLWKLDHVDGLWHNTLRPLSSRLLHTTSPVSHSLHKPSEHGKSGEEYLQDLYSMKRGVWQVSSDQSLPDKPSSGLRCATSGGTSGNAHRLGRKTAVDAECDQDDGRDSREPESRHGLPSPARSILTESLTYAKDCLTDQMRQLIRPSPPLSMPRLPRPCIAQLSTPSRASSRLYHCTSQSKSTSQLLAESSSSFTEEQDKSHSDHRLSVDGSSSEMCYTRRKDSGGMGVLGFSGSVHDAVSSAAHTSSRMMSGQVAEVPDPQFSEDYEIEKYHQKVQQLPRQWEWTPYGASRQSHHGNQETNIHRGKAVEVSVMTYNILAQNLLQNHHYLYTWDTPQWLEWPARRRLLMAEIAYHRPDIVNLQEVHKDDFFEYLQPRLERLGYVGKYLKRTGDKSDGCVTMWKKDKFRVLSSTPVKYCRGGLLDRDNIAIIVELQPVRGQHTHQQEADDKLVVANTHLLFNPRRGDIKLAQLMILMAEIDRHARLNPIPQDGLPCHHSSYCPVILTGDFNMLPHSPLYNFVVSGRMDYEGQLARHISGQEEGRYGGNNYYLHRNFFSPMYGVTETCQYHTAISSRLQQGDKPRQGRQGKQQVVSDRTGGEQRENWRHQEHHEEAAVNTGCISHGLNLLSAYRHNIERLGSEQEVTTHHKRAHCSVDYIFYSIAHREVQWRRDQVKLSRVRDGRLSLLARYGLMSARELDHMGGLPNHLLPSDHLCLITKFLLK